MKWAIVALLSLVLGMPGRAYAGHWIIEETDSRYLVEYVPDPTDKTTPPTAPKREQFQPPVAPSSASKTVTADAGPPVLQLAPQDPIRAEGKRLYDQKRIEEREARRQERASRHQDRAARWQ